MQNHQALIDGFLSGLFKSADNSKKGGLHKSAAIHRLGKWPAYLVGSGPGLYVQLLKQYQLIKDPRRRAESIKRLLEEIGKGPKNLRMAGFTMNGKAFIDGGRYLSRSDIRDAVNHELFHLKPIIGRFETPAYMYGGLTSQKGKLSPCEAIRGYRRAWKAAPTEVAIEHGLAGSVAATGVLGAYAIKQQRKSLENKQNNAIIN